MKIERRTQCSTSGKLFNGAQRGAGALVEIHFFYFLILFLYFSLILHHSNRNHTKFEIKWMEGVA
jgi:preprotein translocase subunit SecG